MGIVRLIVRFRRAGLPPALLALMLTLLPAACTGASTAAPPTASPARPPAAVTGAPPTRTPTVTVAPASPAPAASPAVAPPTATPTAPPPASPTAPPAPSPVPEGPRASAEVQTVPAPAAASAPPPEASLIPLPPLPAVTPRPMTPAVQRPDGSRQRTITLDPGHGGAEVGSAGAGLAEKNANLAIAVRLRRLLADAGYRVVMTRETDQRAYVLPPEQAENARSITRADLQARVDIANQARADVFLSVHNNGSNDPGQSGTEVWYAPDRPFGALNKALAEEALAALVEEIRGQGHPVANRGIKDDTTFRFFNDRYFPIFVLGPARTPPAPTRATQMPGILGETLFMSNPREAQLLTQESMQEAIARGYFQGVQRYFARMDAGEFRYSPP